MRVIVWLAMLSFSFVQLLFCFMILTFALFVFLSASHPTTSISTMIDSFFPFPPCNMCIKWAVISPFSTVCTTCYYANKTTSLVIRLVMIIRYICAFVVHDCSRSNVNLVPIWIKTSYVRPFVIFLISFLVNPCCLFILVHWMICFSPFLSLFLSCKYSSPTAMSYNKVVVVRAHDPSYGDRHSIIIFQAQ